MQNREIVFLDTETTGLDPLRAEVIEFAAIRKNADGTETRFHTLICPQRSTAREPIGLRRALLTVYAAATMPARA